MSVLFLCNLDILKTKRLLKDLANRFYLINPVAITRFLHLR